MGAVGATAIGRRVSRISLPDYTKQCQEGVDR